MGYFALIKDGLVSGVIVADQEFIDQTPPQNLDADFVVDVNYELRPGPGCSYNSQTGVFTPPDL